MNSKTTAPAPQKTSSKDAKRAARQARLNQSLRANLQKRKAQTKAGDK